MRLQAGSSNPIVAQSSREDSFLQTPAAGAARAAPQGVEEVAFSPAPCLDLLRQLCILELIPGAACAGATWARGEGRVAPGLSLPRGQLFSESAVFQPDLGI